MLTCSLASSIPQPLRSIQYKRKVFRLKLMKSYYYLTRSKLNALDFSRPSRSPTRRT